MVIILYYILYNHELESPKSEPAIELHCRAAPSVEAHHPVAVLTQEEIPEEGGYKN